MAVATLAVGQTTVHLVSDPLSDLGSNLNTEFGHYLKQGTLFVAGFNLEAPAIKMLMESRDNPEGFNPIYVHHTASAVLHSNPDSKFQGCRVMIPYYPDWMLAVIHNSGAGWPELAKNTLLFAHGLGANYSPAHNLFQCFFRSDYSRVELTWDNAHMIEEALRRIFEDCEHC